jgi:hypothetical protein
MYRDVSKIYQGVSEIYQDILETYWEVLGRIGVYRRPNPLIKVNKII